MDRRLTYTLGPNDEILAIETGGQRFVPEAEVERWRTNADLQMEHAISAEDKLYKIASVTRGDWGINSRSAMETICDIIDPRSECRHAPDLGGPRPIRCIHCGAKYNYATSQWEPPK